MNKERFLHIEQVVMRTSDITAMLRSILRALIWFFQPRIWTAHSKVFTVGPIVCLFFWRVLVAFVFFRIVRSVISPSRKKKTAMRRLVHELHSSWTTRCPKTKPKFVKLMGVRPIWRINLLKAGPARTWPNLRKAWSVRFNVWNLGFVERDWISTRIYLVLKRGKYLVPGISNEEGRHVWLGGYIRESVWVRLKNRAY